MATKPEHLTDRYYFERSPFDTLMQERIHEILLLCSNYDRFILEEDGRIDEQVFQEYVSLGLRSSPKFTTVASLQEAMTQLDHHPFDLVIVMLNIDEGQAFIVRRKIKEAHPDKPVIVLTRFSRELSLSFDRGALARQDNIFHWLGNTNILPAIIKLIEDRLNVDHDVKEVGVYTIILVENSTRYYSSYLPIIYRAVFEQQRMMADINAHQRSMRMRGRPKILLATNFEEAVDLYERYRSNLLGVISDVSYHHGGRNDPKAGLNLCQVIRERDPQLPILLQSSQEDLHSEAAKYNAAFFHKNSRSLLQDLRAYIRDNFGFGDFVFRMPGTMREVARASSLFELQRRLATVPKESIEFHTRNQNFSVWLKARALFSLGNYVADKRIEDFDGGEEVRSFLIDTIKNYRMDAGRGAIATFEPERFDKYAIFQRIGDGSLGGKARGIAFMSHCFKRRRIMFHFDGITLQIPKTVVLTTSVFEQFMDSNALYDIAMSDRSDDEILARFKSAYFPDAIMGSLRSLVSVITHPLAVRSSSLLEDSHYQPFAGVYATHLIPNTHSDVEVRAQRLATAIKAVYASAYFRDSKAYLRATHNAIDEEKMAVIVQEVTGTRYGNLYYPTFSGVARSLNYYPLEGEQPKDGVVNVAVGLGKWVVDGRPSLRFSPAHPGRLWQLSDVDTALRSTQKKFFAVNLEPDSFRVTTDEQDNLTMVRVNVAADIPANRSMMSTFDFENHRIRDDPNRKGRKLVTFSPILRCGTFPLADILKLLLDIGSAEMRAPVEIEFAVDLDVPPGEPMLFKFLQIRPIVESLESENVRLDKIPSDQRLIAASTALGNGVYEGLKDVIYVKPKSFDRARTATIAATIGELNKQLTDERRSYILIGPGRWGTTDPWLGVPIVWANISNARVIVEASLEDFRTDPSQGSHFFQNLTSFRVAYLNINPSIGDGSYDVGFLDQTPALFEDDYVRHVRFDSSVLVKVDGRRSSPAIKAVIVKPKKKKKKSVRR